MKREYRPSQLPAALLRAVAKTIPKTTSVAVALREGFYQCLTCWHIFIERDPDAIALHCDQCDSTRIKFHPGIGTPSHG